MFCLICILSIVFMSVLFRKFMNLFCWNFEYNFLFILSHFIVPDKFRKKFRKMPLNVNHFKMNDDSTFYGHFKTDFQMTQFRNKRKIELETFKRLYIDD